MAEEYKRFGDYLVYLDNEEVAGVFHNPDSELEDLQITDLGLPIDYDSFQYKRFDDVVVVLDHNDAVLNVLTDQDPELGLSEEAGITEPEIDEPLDSMEIDEPLDSMDIDEPSSD